MEQSNGSNKVWVRIAAELGVLFAMIGIQLVFWTLKMSNLLLWPWSATFWPSWLLFAGFTANAIWRLTDVYRDHIVDSYLDDSSLKIQKLKFGLLCAAIFSMICLVFLCVLFIILVADGLYGISYTLAATPGFIACFLFAITWFGLFLHLRGDGDEY